jgi:hypothetical protein
VEDFGLVIETTAEVISAGVSAKRFVTDADNAQSARDGDVEFWRASSGQLFYHGSEGKSGSPVRLTEPVLVGQQNMMVGSTFNDTGMGTAFLLGLTRNLAVSSTVQYTDVFPTFVTPLGTFLNVLRVEIEIEGTATVGGFPVNVPLHHSTMFLKEGVGIIAQDFAPDANDQEIQAIDAGTVFVGGHPVVVTPQ